MNYLAHAYLSFGDPAWTTGNLISDFVKGRKRYDYPGDIQQGIYLHRAIDDFTDTHEAIKPAKEIFRPVYRLYSGAFVDVVYDHFLANDPLHFADGDVLLRFAGQTYLALQQHYHLLPSVFHNRFDRMRQHNWLYNYRFNNGMEQSFKGLVYRSKYLTDAATAYTLFEENYGVLKNSYEAFFPLLYNFALQYVNDNFKKS